MKVESSSESNFRFLHLIGLLLTSGNLHFHFRQLRVKILVYFFCFGKALRLARPSGPSYTEIATLVCIFLL